MSMITFVSQVFKDADEDGVATEDPTASRKIVIPSDKVIVRDALSFEYFKDILANLHSVLQRHQPYIYIILKRIENDDYLC